MSKPTLTDLKAFQAVAEHRSFRRAADLMGVSRSSLSHTVRTLEQRLGTRLLHRTTRSVSLTESGERLLLRLSPLLSDLESILEDASSAEGKITGRLRINGSEGAVRLLLQTVVPRFLALHDGVELDLVAEGRLVDIVEQGFDAGVRLREAVPQDMVAIPVGHELRFLAVASPGYLRGRVVPKTPDDLASHQCIRQRLPSGKLYRWEFQQHGQDVAVDVPGALTLDSSQLMVEAAADDLGIAYVPEPYAQDYLRDGRLVTVLEEWCPSIPGLFLYYPNNRHVPPSLRAFIDLLRALQG
ncbi:MULTISPECIES: LysR family transcriptional regulator [Halomonadaceae]|jgi:DNA-binding transcriptional LysR family regulator|uniref:LysR family transcriptional regulator n=1 Tax=Halomonadaceae TaxID=28256 RepID=UPI0012EEFCE9|nr:MULTISPECIES: LysR family transcriptional regulator [Halomonas]CAD5275766.1 Transcriptional regulator, LysR family [Halomonas sp. 156]CAD5276179.1 Transcriptional regulator, LysR family [Halomonas sp. 113]CAD5277662.1 Transcriptional regulator, LysR family [Halomonas sp. 59]CAD5283271.1 Transcriptional regulator, LysR family [Halomonas sp. I3]VXC02275.1 Transcriptional regulator, LysR family [Halomonas titanicae]